MTKINTLPRPRQRAPPFYYLAALALFLSLFKPKRRPFMLTPDFLVKKYFEASREFPLTWDELLGEDLDQYETRRGELAPEVAESEKEVYQLLEKVKLALSQEERENLFFDLEAAIGNLRTLQSDVAYKLGIAVGKQKTRGRAEKKH